MWANTNEVKMQRSLRHMIQDNLNEVKRQRSSRNIIQGKDRLDEVKMQPFSRL
jgi:hypothetical protein